MDAWILMLNREINGEFNRELYLLKAAACNIQTRCASSS